MPSPVRLLLGAALLGLAFAAGIYVQHRWPLGRVFLAKVGPLVPAGRTPADIAAVPRARRLVLVAAGQSNAANYVSSRAAAGPGVFVFYAGALHQAIDPLPGGDGIGGSLWTRLGARLATSGRYDAIVLGVAAEGSTRADDWAPGGRCHTKLTRLLRDLRAASLPVDAILWEQGENEAMSPTDSARDYAAHLAALQAACRELAPGARFLVARATWRADTPINDQIRLAQLAAARAPGAAPGPDLDELRAEFRSDGVHFNARGAETAAALWHAALDAALVRPAPPAPPP